MHHALPIDAKPSLEINLYTTAEPRSYSVHLRLKMGESGDPCGLNETKKAFIKTLKSQTP